MARLAALIALAACARAPVAETARCHAFVLALDGGSCRAISVTDDPGRDDGVPQTDVRFAACGEPTIACGQRITCACATLAPADPCHGQRGAIERRAGECRFTVEPPKDGACFVRGSSGGDDFFTWLPLGAERTLCGLSARCGCECRQ